jgi:hypothetical protein
VYFLSVHGARHVLLAGFLSSEKRLHDGKDCGRFDSIFRGKANLKPECVLLGSDLEAGMELVDVVLDILNI